MNSPDKSPLFKFIIIGDAGMLSIFKVSKVWESHAY